MPTKYHRQSFRDHVAEQHPYLRVSRTSAPPVAEKVRRPGYMLTASICAIIAVLLLGNALAKISEYYGQPEIKGNSHVFQKLEEAGTRRTIVVFVDILRPVTQSAVTSSPINPALSDSPWGKKCHWSIR